MIEATQESPRAALMDTAGRGAIVALAAVLALLSRTLPAPTPESAPAEEFSALRAERHIEALSRAPRPVGSTAHDEAADYVLAEMRRLGLEVETQTTTWVRSSGGGRQVVVRVRNLVGRLVGSAATADTLLLLAHYDSQPQTLGAGDDASGVAVILETLRALTSIGTPSNEIIVAITDAEELGLVGAEAFVGEHRWFERVDLTLNLEARGNRGPALMFETSEGALEWVRDFAREAPYPIADSLSYEVYRRMPNDTDFSVVRRAEGQGLNFAFVGNHPAYHSLLDSTLALDLRTVQQEGENALALARHWTTRPLGADKYAEGVYFNPLGSRILWVYSERTARALALAAALALLGAVAYLRRAGLRWPRVLRGLGLWIAAAGATVGLSWLASTLIGRTATVLSSPPHGVPYAQGLATIAFVLMAAGIWLGGLAFWRGERVEITVAVAILWSVPALLSVWFMVGTSHLFVWPALLLATGFLAATASGSERVRWWAVTLAVLPAVAWWTPTLELAYLSLTVHAAPILAVPTALAVTLLTPAFATASRTTLKRLSVWLLVLGVSLLAWTVVGDRGSREHPRVDSLFFLQDAESGEATWRTLDPSVDAWTQRVLGTQPERRELPPVLGRIGRPVLTAVGDPLPDVGPAEIELEQDERPGRGRRMRIRLRTRGAAVLRVWVSSQVELTSAVVDGRVCELDELGELRFSYHGVSAEGLILEVEMSDRWPLYVDVIELTYGLPEGVPGPRPENRIPRPGWWTDTTMIRSSATL